MFDICITMGVLMAGFPWQIVDDPATNAVRGSMEGSNIPSTLDFGVFVRVGFGLAARNGVTVKVRMAPVEVVIVECSIAELGISESSVLAHIDNSSLSCSIA